MGRIKKKLHETLQNNSKESEQNFQRSKSKYFKKLYENFKLLPVSGCTGKLSPQLKRSRYFNNS